MSDVTAIRVPENFTDEFPGCAPAAAELAANLVRTGDAFLAEVQRRRRRIANLSPSAFEALAVLEGAGEPLAPRDIADRLLVSSASMTSLLDTLERQGLVERHPHPTDRRKVLIHLSGPAREIVDKMLPSVHGTATEAMADLTPAEQEAVITALARVRARLATMSQEPIPAPGPRHKVRGGG